MTMHEILHSLGLDHNTEPSIMTDRLDKQSRQLFFEKDIVSLQSIHGVGDPCRLGTSENVVEREFAPILKLSRNNLLE